MSTNLDNILAAARTQATELQPLAGAPLPAVTPLGGSGGAVASYNMSEDAFLNPGGMECDTYIQVKDAGIKLNKDWDGFLDDFEAIIDLQDVQYFMGIRKEVGSNVSYAKSYDGVSTSRGENFAQVVEEFKRTSQKPADTYRGADIPMTLVGDYKDPKDKGTTKPRYTDGQVVGLTTSITGFKPWANFARKLKNAGLGATQIKIKIKVTHSPRRNAQGQAYGVCEFDVVEVLGGAAAQAA